MKTTSVLLVAIAAFLILAGFTACEKEITNPVLGDQPAIPVAPRAPEADDPLQAAPAVPHFQESLAGLWNVTSYKSGEIEYISTLVKSMTIRFSASIVEPGTFEQTVYFGNGERSSIRGSYTVNEAEGAVTLRNAEGMELLCRIVIHNSDQMVWTGTEEDGRPLVILANRQQ